MFVLRHLSERLLQIVALVVWAACWAQATAFATALLLTLAITRLQAPSPWGAPVLRASLSLGAIFLVGGVLLHFLRVRAAAADRVEASDARWTLRDVLLCGSLLALSIAALLASADLLALWRDTLTLLDRVGAWREISRSGPGAGIMLLPLFAILYTPALTGFAAVSLIALPFLLAVALAARSPRFGGLFTRAVICCAVLVGASLVATDLFHRLADVSEPALRSRPEPAALEVADGWRRAAEVLLRSTRWQALILLGHVVWLPLVLRQERRAAIGAPDMAPPVQRSPLESRVSIPLTSKEPPVATGVVSEAKRFGRSTDSILTTRRPERGVRALARVGLLVMGFFLLTIGLVDLLRPQARWIASNPEPGATLDSTPQSVSVTFGRELRAESSLEVIQTLAGGPGLDPPAAGAGMVARNQRVDPGDRRTLRTELAPGAGEGLYWVRWRAVSVGWGVPRRGSYAFRVGTSIPELHLGERGRPSRETTERQRQRSSILLGGAMLVLLGFAVPRTRLP